MTIQSEEQACLRLSGDVSLAVTRYTLDGYVEVLDMATEQVWHVRAAALLDVIEKFRDAS